MIIYKITNKINGKVYIGQTKRTLLERWHDHCCDNRKRSSLHLAIKKYGKENFTVEQIDVACDFNELDLKEIYWIKYYDSMNPEKGYNLTSGGHKYHVYSDEAKKKISEAGKGRIVSEETRKKLSVASKSRIRTDEWKQKTSKTLMGHLVSEESRKKMSLALRGRKLSREHVQKICKRILCVETGKIYNSIKQAAKENNICYCSLCKACGNPNKKSGKLHWRYVDE